MAALFNRIILLGVLSLLVVPITQAQTFSWAQSIDAMNAVYGTGVATATTDTAGNIYTVGGFGGTTSFAGTSLTAVSHYSDMFVMKQDSSGNLLWVKQVKGLSNSVAGCYGRAVDVDKAGNVFISGTVRDSFDFDPGPAVYKVNSFGGRHAFILKLDSAGTFIWVKHIGTQIPNVYADVIAARLDRNGNLYLAAYMPGDGTTPIDVDPGPVTYNITPTVSDLLLEKLDSNGNFVWAKVITGDNAKTPMAVGLDSASNMFVAGRFLGSADFDPGPAVYTLDATPSTTVNAFDIFVSKYDSAGNFGWAHSLGSNGSDAVWAGTVDPSGNVLLTGAFGGTVDFDPGPGTYNLTSASTRSIFTLKLRNNGNFAWAGAIGNSAGLYEGRALTTDQSGNVYTAAIAPGGCDVDPGPATHAVGGRCILQKLDSAGNFVWGVGWGADAPSGVTLPKKDSTSVYICGSFGGGIQDFDPGPGVYSLSTSSNRNGFILKLNQTVAPTGIEEAILQPVGVSVYPNPTSGLVTVAASTALQSIEVTDVAGRVIYRAEPNGMNATVDLRNRTAGVYFYEVSCGSGKQRGKLVIR